MPTYTTPVLSGSVPNPVTQPLQGVLDWTQSESEAQAALLMHFDTTPFVDSSGNNIAITNGGASLNTSTPQFGAGDVSATPNGSWLSFPNAASGPLDFGTGDFTIEFWFRLPTAGAITSTDSIAFIGNLYADWLIAAGLSSIGPPGGPFPSFQIALQTQGSSGASVQTNLFSVSLNTWYSVAFVRQGSSLFAFLNGVLQQTAPITGAVLTPAGNTSFIGKSADVGGGQNFLMDELRITVGTALYTTSYTPATGPFTGGGVAAPGYDIYRDGVSIATVGQVLTYTDNVPSAGTYTYNVAAYDPSIPGDISAESNTVSLDYVQAVVGFPNTIFDEVIFGAYFGGQLNLVEFTYMPGRTPFEQGATNLIINRYLQEPTDVRQRGVDFTQFAVPGELLQTVAVSGINAQGVPQDQTNPLVTPLVVTNLVIDPVTQLKFGYTVSGGQDGIEYTIQFMTTTNIQEQTLEEIFSINFRVENMFP